MSVRRYQPEPRPPEHRSIEHPSDHDRPYHLRRFNRSRNRVNTKSLQSIELNRASTLLPQKNHSQRRKLLSLERNDPSEQATERAELQQSVRHLPAEPHAKPPHRPLRTIETGNLEARERRIKDCIQLMQGVLSEIQHQKSQKGGVAVAVAVTQAAGGECPEGGTVGSKEGSLSKFENYVRKVVNLRQDSKVIILRKAKTKSLIANNSAVRSTAILNAHRFDTIREAKPRQIAPYNKRKERPYFAEGGGGGGGAGGMDQLECSSIEGNNNQSSFISSVGKEALMRDLEEEREKSTLDPSNKLVHRLKNHRKLKNVFPDGFF